MAQGPTLSKLLKRNRDMLHKHLSDFSDADLLVRPVPNANHAAWQLTHALKSSTAMANGIAPDAPITFPEKYLASAAKEAATSDDPNRFPRKDELLQLYDGLFTALQTAVEFMPDDRLAAASPEQFQKFAPTVGELVLMIPLHTTLHIGQIQVIRRKLNKPVLF